MTRTKAELVFFLPTGSFARINDAIEEVRTVLAQHKATDFFITYSGPFPDVTGAPINEQGTDLGPARGRGTGAAAGAEPAEGRDADGGAGDEPAEPVKRKRGSPPGGKQEAPEAEGAEQPRTRRERPARDVGAGTDPGADKGDGEGEGSARRPRADRGAERGTAQPAQLSKGGGWDGDDEDEDEGVELGEEHWAGTPGDEWPDQLMPGVIDKDALTEALTRHYEVSKDREATTQVLERTTGERTTKHVSPGEYDVAIRALMKDAARRRFGIA